ncbi:NDxxF motif lipoprotein [Alkalihalobacillus trypoxylicola]|uniref:NDxxF motif lipoprotein n=1 Tax=Alkalihalobacillus trypoxylicola TaxID=519424 RepID=A0A162DGG6_9BACI|nr:NDxxF motif lipoprotein [Alkalihalobacillus trypoxylicola]KYG29550.1 hypothetical protein AZF04_08515 [Alkalihalobacillus trypoxylicola]
MRKWYMGLIAIFILAGCYQQGSQPEENTTNEVVDLAEITIPDTVFQSEKTDASISEEEMKQSLQTYLDSSANLYELRIHFENFLDIEHSLDTSELEKLEKINALLEQNDHNFSDFISKNTLPEDFAEETEHISHYITAHNQYLIQLDQVFNELSDGEMTIEQLESLANVPEILNGREQQKIEDFLKEKEIQTNVFE